MRDLFTSFKDNCGFGLLASIDNTPSHRNLEDAVTSLSRMMHRGAVAADGKTGDGSGLLLSIPKSFFAKEAKKEGITLPDVYAVAMVFSKNEKDFDIIKEVCENNDLKVVYTRTVPIDTDALGEQALVSLPTIKQVFISPYSLMGARRFDALVYLSRKEIEAKISEDRDFYIPSFSTTVVSYKGLVMPTHIKEFYQDLANKHFEISFCLFHQRFSTNTLPEWRLAQPFRTIAHNGEINSVTANRFNVAAKLEDLKSDVFSDEEMKRLFPIIQSEMSDSASLDNFFEFLRINGMDFFKAARSILPAPWQNAPHMDAQLRAFYEYASTCFEPWDGPAAVSMTDGRYIGCVLDRNGLRPAKYIITTDNRLLISSEYGVLETPEDEILERGRLQSGEMMGIDLKYGKVLKNDDINEYLKNIDPYDKWLNDNMVYLQEHMDDPFSNVAIPEKKEMEAKQRFFNITLEVIEQVFEPMVKEGKEATASMGDDAPLAAFSTKQRNFSDFFKQKFAQVTNPPIDPIREKVVMSLNTGFGETRNILSDDAEHAKRLKTVSPILSLEKLELLKAFGNEKDPKYDAAYKARTYETTFNSDLKGSLAALVATIIADVKHDGIRTVVLDDRALNSSINVMPMLMVIGRLNQALLEEGERHLVSIVAATGEVYDSHMAACMLGFGVAAEAAVTVGYSLVVRPIFTKRYRRTKPNNLDRPFFVRRFTGVANDINSYTGRKRVRRSFGKIREVAQMPNLIEVQRDSYAHFLQQGVPADERKLQGLHKVLTEVFPIKDFSDKAEIDYVSYELEQPKYDVEECQQRSMTYSAPLRVTLRLSVFDVDEDTGLRSIRDIKEQDVYMVDMPLMTDNGTFVVNGTERVIVSQMHRSPGVFFDHDKGKTHVSGKYLFSTRVIPYRGSWLDFEFDAKDLMYVRIDRRRKLPVTTFMRALNSESTMAYLAECEANDKTPDPLRVQGMSNEEILSTFYETVAYDKTDKGWKTPFNAESYRGVKLAHDLVDAKTGKVIAKAEEKITPRKGKKLVEEGLKDILIQDAQLIGSYLAEDIFDAKTGQVYFEAGHEITEEDLVELDGFSISTLPILDIDHLNVGPYIRNTLQVDKCDTREEALIDIYRVMRPGEPPTVDSAQGLFNTLFFDAERYDLSDVGRNKMNTRLDLDTPDEVRVLTKTDIIAMLQYLHGLKDGKGEVDDIDNLGNRRVRSVGELMENQIRVGLLRMERAIRERMSSVEIDTYMPHDLINAKPAAAAVREFFGSSQLSQFMDQTNPLSEITHKRRLSALGPGGLTRERAGFEVRDVHPTHYGRICPIETPEGPNIGLINSLATFARVNKYGFIEGPYRRVIDGKVTDEVIYMSAMEESKYTVAQANAKLTGNGGFEADLVSCRKSGDNLMSHADHIEFMDVSPKQIVSVAASLIPFLENDDANRALMGSNMMRQAVPLLKAEAPLVGTGMEATVARDSGAAVTARRSGIVVQIDAKRIVIRATEETDASEAIVDIYKMKKFQRSNQSTCILQKPLVRIGDKISAGDIIADGPSTDMGELGLGRNVLVAFMPWNGYNFEDSILLSERIVKEDVYTSIHIQEYDVMARDTKLGTEEITRDIPNVGEEALKHLDESGIVHIGAEVSPGDILVGKVTPKGESPMTPEEKLLRAIFGEKAADVKDTSLRMPSGAIGTIVDVRVFNRRGIDKDERAMDIERSEIEHLAKDRDDERRILEEGFYGRLEELLMGQTVAKAYKDGNLKKGDTLTSANLSEMKRGHWRQIVIADEKVMEEVEAISRTVDLSVDDIKERFENKVEKLQRGDELMPGVMKMVKIFVAIKRKLQPGDKMAGRHGNKGVVSRIMPVEDMPYTEDGTPVDIVLNPLGVPSRMNVGQILETHLGWASVNLGRQIGDALDAFADRKAPAAAEIKTLKETLHGAYGDSEMTKKVDLLDDKEVVEMAGNLRKGVPMATPVFDGAVEADIDVLLERAGLETTGQMTLIDGRTGEKFDRKVTVGIIYMLKLHHLVDDKIHARSIGPYSLVTQQPLGGKAQFGGQRFGEMECWALQAYGAAYTLQEMLTIKSDDVAGRSKVYESIVRGEDTFEIGVPESFNVLTKELKALGLNIDMQQSGKN